MICDKHEGPIHRSDDRLISDLLKHIRDVHSVSEIWEVLGRFVVGYVEKELGRKLEGDK